MKTATRNLLAITLAFVVMPVIPLHANEGDIHAHDHDDGSDMSSMGDMSSPMGEMSKPMGEMSKPMGEMSKPMGEMSKPMGAMFLVKRDIDGYGVSFHVMQAKPGKEMGGSHDFMIKVERDGRALTDVVMNTKVVHPDGRSETKPAMKMGDWLMAGYDLGHEGKHQLLILFRTPDGQKHQGGVNYPSN